MTTTLEFESAPSARPAGQWRETRVFTALPDLARLEEAWRSLGEQPHGSLLSGPTEQFDWVATCAAWGPVDRQLRIVAVTRGETLLGVMPLESRAVHGSKRLVMLGAQELHEPTGLLADDRRTVGQLAAALAEQRQPILLERMVVDPATLEVLCRELGQRGRVVVRGRPSYPWIPLDASWQEPEVHLNSGRRSDLRRSRRKAEKLGEVTTQIISPRLDELDVLLDEAFAVEARSWKGLEGTALARDAGRAAFYRQYARAVCRQGALRMCFLRIGGQAVATQIAIVQGGGFWLMKIGYDAEFSSCSPGMLLLRDSIAYAAEAGCRTFEFLGQTEPWIAMWTDQERTCVALRMYPYNLRGALALAADAQAKVRELSAAKLKQAASALRSAAKACLMPIVNRAACRYVAGPTLQDAIRVKQRLAAKGFSATIGYWNAEAEAPRAVADHYLAGLDALKHDGESYLSVKLPALAFSSDLLREVGERACASRLRLHFDSMGPEAADRTRALIEELLAAVPGIDVGFTLPGRWRRSVQDARWAAENGLFARVVKGQWSDPEGPHYDARQGYLEVIDQLAGKARRVAVATHDAGLAAEALRRLQAAGTPTEVELLHGLPMQRLIRIARERGVAVRVYIPYGESYLPYALSQIWQNPRTLGWLVRDAMASLLPRRVGGWNR
jgi:CelD/BcsL family acetyltransferase involved in cellulose biosynthesis